MSSARNALLARKEKILKDLKYYESKIGEAKSSVKSRNSSGFEDGDSSDSDIDLTLNIKTGPSIAQLKRQQSKLTTCLRATEELTQLDILQSEVNVMVDDPVIEGVTPVKESGTWSEITAECRVDMIHFSVSFYVHKPHRKFASPSYRGLRVSAVKKNHDAELSKSVLPELTRPSDAVELLRNYAVAHRSRRETLKCLAETFGDTLHMEILPDGGYLLKCNDIFEISWRLQNKWSPVAWFHHRMKFDIETIDESYLKIIRHANNQLPNPALKTAERTMLLSKIISTCLEARGQLSESMESDSESVRTLEQSRTTLDYEPEGPTNHNRKEKELMAPPKSLPKKTKRKSDDVKDGNAKKSRVEIGEEVVSDRNDDGDDKLNGQRNAEKKKHSLKNNDLNTGSNSAAKVAKEKTAKKDMNKNNGKVINDLEKGLNENVNTTAKVANEKTVKNNTKTVPKEGVKDGREVINSNVKNVDEVINKVSNNVKAKTNVQKTSNKPTVPNNQTKKAENIGKSANTQNTINKAKPKLDKPVEKIKPKSAGIDAENDKNIPNKIIKKPSVAGKIKTNDNSDKKLDKNAKVVNKSNKVVHETIEKVVEKRQSIKSKYKISEKTVTERVNENAKKVDNIKNNTNQNNDKSDKIIKSTTTVKKTSEIQPRNSNNLIENQQKTLANKPKILTDKHRQSIKNINRNIVNKLTVPKPKVVTASKMASMKQDGVKQVSKIPQKKIAGGVVKKNALRISPRKLPTSLKTSAQGGSLNKPSQKIFTNIPRLLKKPITKATQNGNNLID